MSLSRTMEPHYLNERLVINACFGLTYNQRGKVWIKKRGHRWTWEAQGRPACQALQTQRPKVTTYLIGGSKHKHFWLKVSRDGQSHPSLYLSWPFLFTLGELVHYLFVSTTTYPQVGRVILIFQTPQSTALPQSAERETTNSSLVSSSSKIIYMCYKCYY